MQCGGALGTSFQDGLGGRFRALYVTAARALPMHHHMLLLLRGQHRGHGIVVVQNVLLLLILLRTASDKARLHPLIAAIEATF